MSCDDAMTDAVRGVQRRKVGPRHPRRAGSAGEPMVKDRVDGQDGNAST